MRYRDDPIVVYQEENGNKRCRACSSEYMRSVITDRSGFGRLPLVPWTYKVCHESICCSYSDSETGERWYVGWDFDNTKHEIIVSTIVCKLCPTCVDGCESKERIKMFAEDIEKAHRGEVQHE